ncbi:unnamed protein product [Microthlaspi erraticum]|uniref:Uncharacterized protein n=1 Tax=Microthlaspi erraticum TaxID=1685480 RepID=A0A6D2JH56_9BRAS|nr:unnamed protein product [Microthlaspi erraticum]
MLFVIFAGPSRRARSNSKFKEKFRLLKELSHRLWPKVVAALEKKKQERKDKRKGKSKSAIPATPISTVRPSRSEKKPMGLKKRAAMPIDDVVGAQKEKGLRRGKPRPLASTSVPDDVPEKVIELESPPFSDHDESSHHDESASHHDEDLRTPVRGGSPFQGNEFLTPRGDTPSFDQRDRGGFEEGESSRRPGENDEAASHHSETGGFAPHSNLGAKGDTGMPKDGPEGYNPHAFKTWWNGENPLMEDQDACGGATWMSKVHPG